MRMAWGLWRRRLGVGLLGAVVSLFTLSGALAAPPPRELPKLAGENPEPLLIDPGALAKPEKPVWDKQAPTTIDDLRSIQRRLQKSIPNAIAATVGVYVGNASGSGVIVSKDGLVLTAAHVIGTPGIIIDLVLADGRKVKAKTLGAAPGVDAGMIKIIDKGDYPFAPLGDVATTVPGEWCFAVGHPSGPDKQRGAVVRIGRVITANPAVVWTDCKLLGGDSGGPLYDMDGRVIGIHSRIGVPTEMNYHIPLAAFQSGWDRLVAGEMMRDWPGSNRVLLGVVTGEDPKGAKVTEVMSNSSASRAGIQVGDIITGLDGTAVPNSGDIRRLLGSKKVNDVVKVKLLRDGKEMVLEAKLGAPPAAN